VRRLDAVSFQQKQDALQECIDGRRQEMTIENAHQVLDSATAYLRELCPPGMEFVLIVGTTGTDGRCIIYDTSLPPDRFSDVLREALELAEEEDA
jgi:hypothetical protein